jgi:hypothetical protein
MHLHGVRRVSQAPDRRSTRCRGWATPGWRLLISKINVGLIAAVELGNLMHSRPGKKRLYTEMLGLIRGPVNESGEASAARLESEGASASLCRAWHGSCSFCRRASTSDGKYGTNAICHVPKRVIIPQPIPARKFGVKK